MEEEKIKQKIEEHYKYIGERIVLVADRNYRQLLPYFVKLLRRTRIPFLKKNGLWVGALQKNMLKTLSEFQEKTRELKTKLKNKNIKEKEKKNLESELLIYREWIRVFQTITDGIAWRNLDFNRPIIRLLSENQSYGHIDQSYAQELGKALGYWPGVVLINDLTRCLRIGDITQIKDGKIVLYESKKDGKVIKNLSDIFDEAKKHGADFIFGNNKSSRQRHRQWTVQMSIINKSIDVPLLSDKGTVRDAHRAEIIDSNVKIPTHFSAIKKLIKKANKTGFEQQELEEGYFVEITAWDKIGLNLKDAGEQDPVVQRKKEARLKRPDWCVDKKNHIIDLSSFESFYQENGEYPRNITPHSVLPFSASDCVRLMMGCLEIKVHLNLNLLKHRLEENGWCIHEIDHGPVTEEKKRQRGSREDFMSEVPREDFYDLSKSDGQSKYHYIMPLTVILFVLSSYYKIDFIINTINDGFERSRHEENNHRNLVVNYLQERKFLK